MNVSRSFKNWKNKKSKLANSFHRILRTGNDDVQSFHDRIEFNTIHN